MKAITVMQPWATLIAIGAKTIETRPAPPNGPMRPEGVRGLPGLAIEPGERIAIHAGGGKADITKVGLGPYRPILADDGVSLTVPLAFSAVIATAVVVGAAEVQEFPPDGGGLLYPFILSDPAYGGGTPDGTSTLSLWLGNGGCEWIDGALGDFTPGRWGWLLANVTPCEPVQVKGKQGVWRLPDEIAERVQA